MAKSNKPIFWGLFAAGGTVAAFVIPALVLVTLFAAMRFNVDMFTYEAIHGFAAWWFGKLVIFGIITLCLWHGAHRLRVVAHDFGLRADTQIAIILYALACLGTLLTVVHLLKI